MINIKLRLQSVAFWIQLVSGYLIIFGTFLGFTQEVLTSWDSLRVAFSMVVGSPLVLLALLVYTAGCIFDFTVPWFGDSVTTLMKTNINQTAADVVDIVNGTIINKADDAINDLATNPETSAHITETKGE